ncbi:MAG: hypothetical protein FJW92_06690 [Actinobacteria bacterium]|nr:hypothetical protein [Actinomycetota bacterium]
MSGDAGKSDEAYRLGLRALLVQIAPPYGFTLATFASAGLAMYFQDHAPDPWDILLFLVGASTGYAVMVAATTGLRRRVHPRPIPMNSWQMVHVLPLGVLFLLALAAAYFVGYPVAWFTNGAALTLGYLGSLAWVLRFLRRREDAMLGEG